MNTPKYRKLFSTWLPAWMDAAIRLLAEQEHRKIGQQAAVIIEKGLLASGLTPAQIEKLKEEKQS